MNPAGKVALITGGAIRVGRAITLMLARMGANVVVNYNTSGDQAQTTVAEVEALGVRGVAVQCDVSDWDSVQRMAQTIQQEFGGVDILVNAASLFERTPFPSADADVLESWRRVTRISIDGAYYVSNTLAPFMQQRGGGVIVNIIDLSVWEPWRNLTAHAVGKSGMWALTRQMALELAPEIRVNAVAPGAVSPPPEFTEKQIASAARRVLLERWGAPDDVAQAVRYLIEADYVTGDVVTVDGGERYWRHKP